MGEQVEQGEAETLDFTGDDGEKLYQSMIQKQPGGGQDPMVHHPPHYLQGKYEVIDILTAFFPSEPLLWQVVKYVLRAGKKGSEVQDLEKARWYLDRKIATLKGEL